jgi:23S rRNA (uridine2552-2'-O)-methyltransferase
LPRSKSSGKWLREHFDDEFVKRAQKEGYRSRAVYKLLEIQDKDHLIRPGMHVVDLGAAPGSWSQVTAKFVGRKGRVIATDILAMDALADVTFIQGDFREQAVLDAILAEVQETDENHACIDLVMSDMAPNISGMRSVDQPKSMYLVELALDFADKVLCKGGDILVKVFQGEGFDTFMRDMRERFERVYTRKPSASRPRSREVYVIGRGYNQ